MNISIDEREPMRISGAVFLSKRSQGSTTSAEQALDSLLVTLRFDDRTEEGKSKAQGAVLRAGLEEAIARISVTYSGGGP